MLYVGKYLGVSYLELVPLLIEAVRELDARTLRSPLTASGSGSGSGSGSSSGSGSGSMNGVDYHTGFNYTTSPLRTSLKAPLFDELEGSEIATANKRQRQLRKSESSETEEKVEISENTSVRGSKIGVVIDSMVDTGDQQIFDFFEIIERLKVRDEEHVRKNSELNARVNTLEVLVKQLKQTGKC